MPSAASVVLGSLRYLKEAHDLLDRLGSQVDAIETAASWVASSVKAGGLFFISGTGHSHMIAEEVFYRAGGLTAVCPILEPSLLLDRNAAKSSQLERLHDFGRIIIDDYELTARDTLLLASNSGRNAVPIDMALRAKERGCSVIAIISRQHSAAVSSRHRSGNKLADVVDLVIDNCVGYGDASIHLEGLSAPVGPLSTIAGTAIINAIVVRAAEQLLAAGQQPEVFTSANVAVEAAMDFQALRRAQPRIRAL